VPWRENRRSLRQTLKGSSLREKKEPPSDAQRRSFFARLQVRLGVIRGEDAQDANVWSTGDECGATLCCQCSQQDGSKPDKEDWEQYFCVSCDLALGAWRLNSYYLGEWLQKLTSYWEANRWITSVRNIPNGGGGKAA